MDASAPSRVALRQYNPANKGATKHASITPIAIHISQARSSGGLDKAKYSVIAVDISMSTLLNRVIDFS
jgi:hypothetical protein